MQFLLQETVEVPKHEYGWGVVIRVEFAPIKEGLSIPISKKLGLARDGTKQDGMPPRRIGLKGHLVWPYWEKGFMLIRVIIKGVPAWYGMS